MDNMHYTLDQVTGKLIIGAMIEMMAANFEDFSTTQKAYEEAMNTLRASLGDPPIAAEMEAIESQIASDLFFSAFLGIKANWDHFFDPITHNFLDTEPEIYLREHMAHKLPEYLYAQKTRRAFYASLSCRQRETYEDVISYVTYLETAGPKLAHYYGYILGNTLLHRLIPGYRPDSSQTMQYRIMMETYFGQPLVWNVNPFSASFFNP